MSIAKSVMNDGSNGIDAIKPKKRKTRGDIPAEMPEMGTNPTHAHTQDGGLHLDRRNYRKHNERNKQLINKSLKDYGAGRSILADKDGEVVAGNGVFEQAKKLGIPVRVIEPDGSELIAIKRTDLGTDDPRRKQLALADNATSDTSEWDYDVLAEDWDEGILQEWGIEMPEEEEDVAPISGETDPDDVPEVHCAISCRIGSPEILVVFTDKAGKELLSYRETVTPAEVIREFNLQKPRFAEMCRKGLFA